MKFNNAPLSGLSCSSRKESGTPCNTCARLRDITAHFAIFQRGPPRRARHKSDAQPRSFLFRKLRGKTTLFGGVSFYSGEQLVPSHISPSPRFFTAAVFNCIRERKREGDLRHHKFHGAERLFISRGKEKRIRARSLLVSRREGGRARKERMDSVRVSE